MTGTCSFHARTVGDADLHDVAELLALTFGGSSAAYGQTFEYWWNNNPAWQSGMPKGWLVRSPDGKPIAFTANIPFEYIINGESGLCFATGSTSVSTAWRGHKLSKLVGVEFLRQPGGDFLIGTDSTPAAYQLWLGLGMRGLAPDWPANGFRIFADSQRLMLERGNDSNLSRPLKSAAGGAIAALVKLGTPRICQSLAIKRVDAFADSDSDRIGSFRAASDATTYAVRNAQVLNWLYCGSEFARQTRAAFAAYDRNELVGYLAIKRTNRSFQLLECRCRDADPEIARGLILAARDYAEQQGAYFLNVWRYSKMIDEAIPRAIGTSLFSRPMMTYCYLSRRGEVDEKKWETTPGDGDVSVN
jgi:hypothetical protein